MERNFSLQQVFIGLEKLSSQFNKNSVLNPKINLLLSNPNEQLNFRNLEIDNPIKKCEKAIEISIKTEDSFKILIQKSNFKSENEEIQFFKEIKPQFTSKIICYNTIFNIGYTNQY